MNEDELAKIVAEIETIAKADREYIKEQDLEEEFIEGWRRGIDQLMLELLGRASEDSVEKLKEVVK
jgi:hypothetical protein